MIEYQLKDKDNNVFSLNGDSVTLALKGAMTQGSDSFSFDNKIVDKSFLAGSKLIGESRIEDRRITLVFPNTNPAMGTFRSDVNEILRQVRKTKYIVDATNGMQIEVVPINMEVPYDAGSLKLFAEMEFRFTALSPYWEDLVSEEITGTTQASVIKEEPYNNEGFIETFPVITLVATVATSEVEVYLVSNNIGIEVLDSAFGTAGNLTMIIDCREGLVSINDNNRNVKISSGTGFFELPVGADTIRLLTNQAISYTIEWHKRCFI